MRIANFYTQSNQFIFQIPKKRGNGYLKSCCGFHTQNSKGILLSEKLYYKNYIDNKLGDYCDIDGYLAINIKGIFACDFSQAKIIENDLKDIIKEVFDIDDFISE